MIRIIPKGTEIAFSALGNDAESLRIVSIINRFAREDTIFGIRKIYVAIAYYPDMVEAIIFEIGGFFQGKTTVSIKKNARGAVVHVDQIPFGEGGPLEDRQITSLRWQKLVNKLYNELYIHEWKKRYNDWDILDGTQWELQIKLNGQRKRTYSGSNAYPPYWKELIALFRVFAKL